MAFFLDFETRSELDLRKVGAHRYAEHESTEVISVAFCGDNSQVEVSKLTPAILSTLRDCAGSGELIVAHNAEFECLILYHVLDIHLDPRRFRCTAAMAARAGLPRGLDAVGTALELTNRKLESGSRLILKLSKPRRPSQKNPGKFWERDTAAEDYAELEEYNAGDVLATRELYNSLPPLSPTEQRLWELTVTMNDRGLRVDEQALERLIQVAAVESARLAARWEKLVGVPGGSPKAAKALGLESIDKAHVRRALKRPDLSPRVREALTIRQRLARSSVRKLVRLKDMLSADGRYRGGLVYAGAERTARWSGRGVQLHNLPQGVGDETDLAFEVLEHGQLHTMYDDVLKACSGMIKGLFVGPYLVGDYAQIEARVLAWLSGQQDLVRDFAEGTDVYCGMASRIYRHSVSKKDVDEKLGIPKRQLGKVVILACGYGLGFRKLQSQLEEKFDILVDEEMSQTLVNAYRDTYPKIVSFWKHVEDWWRSAVRQNKPCHGRMSPNLHVGLMDHGNRRFAFIELPSSRNIYYYSPRADRAGAWQDGTPKTEAAYYGRNIYKGGAWELIGTYGGKLVENIVQAVARDVMAAAMLRLEAAGFKMVLTVHDEIVAEGTADRLEEFKQIMSEVPSWAYGLPIAVDVKAVRRYQK